MLYCVEINLPKTHMHHYRVSLRGRSRGSNRSRWSVTRTFQNNWSRSRIFSDGLSRSWVRAFSVRLCSLDFTTLNKNIIIKLTEPCSF